MTRHLMNVSNQVLLIGDVAEQRRLTATNSKEMTPAAIVDKAAQLRRAGHRLVFTNGCFDVLHPGHVQLLITARALGDFLVVGLNSDVSIRRLKGADRPVVAQADRVAVLSVIEPVDAVVVFAEDTPRALIEALQPDVLVKGGDYRPEEVVGGDIVTACGGRIAIVPRSKRYSTTAILTRNARVP